MFFANDFGVQRCMQFLEVAGFCYPKTLGLEVIDSPTANQGLMPSIGFPFENAISTLIDLQGLESDDYFPPPPPNLCLYLSSACISVLHCIVIFQSMMDPMYEGGSIKL